MKDFIYADTHCHVDLSKDPLKTIKHFEKLNIAVIAMTTTPNAYLKNLEWAKDYDLFKPSLGLHPQLINTKYFDIDCFMSFLQEATFIGEIGLDKSKTYRETFDMQLLYFTKILTEISKLKNKILSIHSLRAVDEVLDLIKKLSIFQSHTCILHWYTGTLKQLEEANLLNCYYSVNHKMLYTNNSKTIIENMPLDKILLESDAPLTSQVLSINYYKSLVKQIAYLKELSDEVVNQAILENSRMILTSQTS